MSIIVGMAVLVWFYLTATKEGQDPIKWVVIGMIGYWSACWVIKLTIVNGLLASTAKVGFGKMVVMQLPALFGFAIAFLVRKKLLADIRRGN